MTDQKKPASQHANVIRAWAVSKQGQVIYHIQLHGFSSKIMSAIVLRCQSPLLFTLHLHQWTHSWCASREIFGNLSTGLYVRLPSPSDMVYQNVLGVSPYPSREGGKESTWNFVMTLPNYLATSPCWLEFLIELNIYFSALQMQPSR